MRLPPPRQNLPFRYKVVVAIFFASLVTFIALGIAIDGSSIVFRALTIEQTAQHFFRFLVLGLLVERVIEALVLTVGREAQIGDFDPQNVTGGP